MVGRHFVYFGFQNCTTTPNRFFGHALLLQVKIRKMAFSAGSLYFMFLEPCSFNINVKKAFHLFLVSKLYSHAQLVFWPRPFYADKIAKKGIFALSFNFLLFENTTGDEQTFFKFMNTSWSSLNLFNIQLPKIPTIYIIY